MRPLKSVLSVLVLLTAAPLLRGQLSLSLSPVQMEFVLNPGKSGAQSIVIGNGSSSPVGIKAGIDSWTVGRPGIDVFPSEGAGALSARDWFQVESGAFEIPPGEQREVTLSITVPENALPGQYTAALSFVTLNEPGKEDLAGGLSLQGKLTAFVIVTVGKPVDAGEIAGLALERRNGQVILVLRRKNSGRFFLPTEGEIILRDAKGKKVYAADFLDDPVPPLSERVFRIPIQGQIALGRYQAECLIRLLTGKKVTNKRPVILE